MAEPQGFELAQATGAPALPKPTMPAPPAAAGITTTTTQRAPGVSVPSYGGTQTTFGTQPTVNAVHQIESQDFIDKMGLGPFAEVITVSMLCMVMTLVVAGLLSWAASKFFGDADYWKARSDAVEKIWFDLTSREAEARTDIEGRKVIKAKLEGTA